MIGSSPPGDPGAVRNVPVAVSTCGALLLQVIKRTVIVSTSRDTTYEDRRSEKCGAWTTLLKYFKSGVGLYGGETASSG